MYGLIRVVAALVVAGSAIAEAQLPRAPQLGHRVRVQAFDKAFDPSSRTPFAITTRVGSVIGMSRDSLVVGVAETRFPLYRHDIVRIEISQGRPHRNLWKGALLGGMVTGIAFGVYGCGRVAPCDDFSPNADSRFTGAFLPGAAIGALVAYLWRGEERWVPADSRGAGVSFR